MPTDNTNQQLIVGYRYDTESGIDVTETNLWDLVPKPEKAIFADLATGINRTINGPAGRRGNPIKATAAARLRYRQSLPEIFIGVWLDRERHTRNGEFCTNSLEQLAQSYKIKILEALCALDHIAKKEAYTLLNDSKKKVPPGNIRLVKYPPDNETEYQIEDPQTYEIALTLRTNKRRRENILIRLEIDDEISTKNIPPSTCPSIVHNELFEGEFSIKTMNKSQPRLMLVNIQTGQSQEATYEDELKISLMEAFYTNHSVVLEYSITGHYMNGELKTDHLNIKKILSSKENKVKTLF